MLLYILRRLVWTIFVLVVVSAITFVVFRVLPSTDAATLRAGRQATPESIALIREQLGLDRSGLSQFGSFLGDLFFRFDLGFSYTNDQPIRPELLDRVPVTGFLILGAAVVWLAVGVTIGIVSAVFRGTIWDRLLMGGALVAISAPVYFLGLVSLYLFSDDIGKFGFLPGAGSYQDAEGLGAKAQSMILPWLVLSTAFAAVYARLLRANLLDTMSEDYIRTARAKGLTERRVVLRHGMRSASTPIVTVLGLDIGILFGGAILTESVFDLPGVGRYAFDAIERGDLATIQGTTVFLALAVALMSLIVDVIYAFLDPRVRY